MKTTKIILKAGRILFIGGVIAFSSSCGGGETKEDQHSDPAETKHEETITPKEETVSGSTNVALYAKGEEVYKQNCQACHQANGEGLPNVFPPLAKSDYLVADKARTIKQIIKGSNGEIVVNGQKYSGAMPPQNLTDEQVADVLNYALNSWGNTGGTVTVDEVKAQRSN